nr:MAG TPA: hypothetical protein [Bacteriophage sp.]
MKEHILRSHKIREVIFSTTTCSLILIYNR